MSQDVQHYDPKNPDIRLSDAAIAQVQSYLDKKGHGIGLRLSITTTGCSGYAYVLDLIDEAIAGDLHSQITDDIAVYVEPGALDLVRGTEIDYVKEGINYRFTYNNPNQKGVCGCGESFAV